MKLTWENKRDKSTNLVYVYVNYTKYFINILCLKMYVLLAYLPFSKSLIPVWHTQGKQEFKNAPNVINLMWINLNF